MYEASLHQGHIDLKVRLAEFRKKIFFQKYYNLTNNSCLPPVYRIAEHKTSFYNRRYITTSTCKSR